VQQALRSDNRLFVNGLISSEDGPASLAGEVKLYEALKSSKDGSNGGAGGPAPLTWALETETHRALGTRYKGPEGAKPSGDDHLAREEIDFPPRT
jgi:hypothetical protein